MPRSFPSASQSHNMRTWRQSSRRQGQRQSQPDSHYAGRRSGESGWQRTRAHLVAAIAEFIGTFLFLWFSFAGTQTAISTGNGPATAQGVTLISLAFGFSLLVTVWAFYRISGGLFNPAVTLGLVITGNLPWFRGLVLLPSQLLGGIVAAGLVRCMLPGPVTVNTTLGAGTTPAQGVFIEMFLTALLVFTILMLAAEKHNATHMAPVGIGLALFVAMMAGVYYTGASLNPARSFGPSVAFGDFPGYHYIYWFGPIMGSLLASGCYSFFKSFNYEEANPGQDALNDKDAERQKSHQEV